MATTELDWEFETGYALTMAELGSALDRTDTRRVVSTLEHYRNLATKHTPPPGKIAELGGES